MTTLRRTPRSNIDTSSFGRCQWLFCKNAGLIELRATIYGRRSHRTTTYLYNACGEHWTKMTIELEDDGHTVERSE